MELNQISIKINQTNQSEGGNLKSSNKSDGPDNSFNQILSMFNLLNQTPEFDRMKPSPMSKNASDRSEVDYEIQKNPSLENCQEIESILWAIVGGTSQGLTIPTDVRLTDKGSLTNEVIQRLRTQDNKQPLEISKDSEDDISKVLDVLKLENTNNVRPADVDRLLQSFFSGLKQNDSNIGKQRMSLDKNHVVFSSPLNPAMIVQGNNNLDPNPINIHIGERTRSNLLSPPVKIKPSGSSGRETSEGMTIPELPISSFVPEVSGWINHIMRISDDQPDSAEKQFALIPNLGEIKVITTSLEGKLSVQILTNSPLSKEMIEPQLQQLKQSLIQSDLSVLGIKIVQNPLVSDRPLSKVSVVERSDLMSPDSLTDNSQQILPPVNFERDKQNEKTINQPPFTKNIVDLLQKNQSMVTINHQVQGIDKLNAFKDELSSNVLPISNFVPNISEWINRYMGISEGQQAWAQEVFQLIPNNLGKLEMNITSQGGGLSVQFATETPLAKEMIESQLQHLSQSLKQEGLKVTKRELGQNLSVKNTLISENQPVVGSEGKSQSQPYVESARINQPKADKNTQSTLDQNQMNSSLTDTGKNNSLESKISKVPVSNLIKDMAKDEPMVNLNFVQPKTDGINEMKLGTPSTNLPVSEFVPEVSEWVGRFMQISEGKSGSTEAKFSLYPENLGPIEVKIVSHQGQVSAQIITDTSSAKGALEGQLHHLKQSLQQHGIIVQKLDIIQQTQQSMESNLSSLSFSQNGSNSSNEQRTFTSNPNQSKKQKGANQKVIENESLAITYEGIAHKTASNIDFIA